MEGWRHFRCILLFKVLICEENIPQQKPGTNQVPNAHLTSLPSCKETHVLFHPFNIGTHYGSFKDWDDILVRLWRILDLPMKSKLRQVRRQAFYVGNLSVEIRLVVKRQGFTVVDARYPAPKWNIHIIFMYIYIRIKSPLKIGMNDLPTG